MERSRTKFDVPVVLSNYFLVYAFFLLTPFNNIQSPNTIRQLQEKKYAIVKENTSV